MLLIKKKNSFRECSFPFYGYSLSIIELGCEGLNVFFFCKEKWNSFDIISSMMFYWIYSAEVLDSMNIFLSGKHR